MVESMTGINLHPSGPSENQQLGHGSAVSSSQKFSSTPTYEENFSFEDEFRNAQKSGIDGRDICIREWDIRDELSGLVESIGTCLHRLFTCHLEVRSGSEGCCEVQECQELDTKVDQLLLTLREENKETEGGQIISGFLD